MTQRATLLAAVWGKDAELAAILAHLENGELQLTGNFKGREGDIARGAREEETREAGDWERKNDR